MVGANDVDLIAIRAACPVCGSDDVVYTCTPNCCFNHVCGTCRASWQLRTRLVDVAAPAVRAPETEYDTSFPTAPCVRCQGLVWQIDGRNELWCPTCAVVLSLVVDSVQPGSQQSPD